MDYRREIDGLRALAVVPVILFHAGFEAFGGGFVGVDVFFVISGYLITSIILSELEQEKFSIVNFYERRARRILPALFLVMFFCVPFAWMWFLPGDMKDFSQSLAAVSAFSSNILFWRESGYFDAAAEFKPLLHTWSLAVEEQYYVFFPILLLCAWQFGRRWVLILLVAVCVASFVFAQWASVAKPSAAFYLLPARGWELLIGAFAAFYLSRPTRVEFGRSVSEIGGWLGVGLLLYSVFAYSKSTPFPGIYALVPTVGAVFIILFATYQTSVGKLVGNKAFVGIGLISYSAYLWHQPLFAFSRYKGLTESHKLEFIGLSILSLLLAFLSWKYVEAPFRNKRLIGRINVFLFGLFGTVFFISIGLFGHLKSGDIGRLNDEQMKFLSHFENELPSWNYFTKNGISEKYRDDCNFYDIPMYRSGRATNVPRTSISVNCFTSNKVNGKQVFIWGDSHAQQLNYGLSKAFGDEVDVLQVASSGCSAMLGATQRKDDLCEYSNWFAFNAIKRLKPKFVIVGQNLGHNSKAMEEISSALLGVGVGKVIFTGPSPHWVPNLPAVVAAQLPNAPKRTLIGVDKSVLDLDKSLKINFSKKSNVSYISLIDYFCNDEGCLVYSGDDVVLGITSWDYGHLTPIASFDFSRDVLAPYLLSQ